MALRCKHCYGIINTDIYAHYQLTRNNQTFSFCQQICLNAYRDRCGIETREDMQVDEDDGKVENRWNILDLGKE